MTDYEITFLTTEDADPGIAGAIEKVSGRITSSKSHGRRPLTYPIKKETAAYYTTLRFSGDSGKVPTIHADLRLMPGLLRYLLVSIPAAATMKASLEVDESLKEAKDLDAGEAATVEKPAATEPTEVKAETAERDKKLQAQLDKLLAGDENESK